MPGPAEVTVRHRKAGRLDNMGRHIQAGAQAQNRSRVLRDVGLEKRDLHGWDWPLKSMKCLNKSRLRAELVHCTLASG